FLATANHNILPEGYKHQIGYEFAAPYRFQRIQQRLSSQEQWKLGDFQALQQDIGSLPGLALARLLSDVALQDQSLEPFAKLFLEWDGKLTVDAKAGPLYAIWLRTLQEEFYAPHVPKELKSTLAALSGLPVMLRALEKADPLWFGPDANASRDRLLRSTFAEAVRKLKALPESQQQRWGALHRVTFRHPLATLGPTLANAFN